MAKVSSKFITLPQAWEFGFAREFERRFGLKVKSLGYGDSSTTTYVFRVQTAKPAREVQDMVWSMNGGGWADVRTSDPRL